MSSIFLKAVTRAKLGYDPIECDPELMVKIQIIFNKKINNKINIF